MQVFGSNGIKQGIKPSPKPPISNKKDDGEYEEYIDPNCGCRKIRKKKTKTEEYESDVKIQSEQIRTEDESKVPKTKRSRKTK